jgi:hypothetical protein
MSQVKVDKYKEKKAKRKELAQKAKKKQMLVSAGGALFLLLIVGWIGYSIVDTYIESQPRQVVEVDYTAIDQFIQEKSTAELSQ